MEVAQPAGEICENLEPRAHVKAYMKQANLFSKNMVVHCKLFPTTLSVVTLEWYYSLPRNSIESFNALCGRFLAKFADYKPIIVTSTSLHNVIQVEGEDLRQYMTKFVRATLNIPDLHPAVSMHILLVGLCP